MKYFIVAIEDEFKDDKFMPLFQAGSGRYSDDKQNLIEIHRIGVKSALSEDLAKQVRTELGKMILEGKCRSWNKMKADFGVLK